MGAWNTRTTRSIATSLEVLRNPINADVTASIVVDASTVAADPVTGLRILKAGTSLSKNVSNQYERYTGAGGQAVRGILVEDLEFVDDQPHSDAVSALWCHGQWFRIDRVVDWATVSGAGPATIGDDIKAALPTCRFD